jgi:hypothetical protein
MSRRTRAPEPTREPSHQPPQGGGSGNKPSSRPIWCRGRPARHSSGPWSSTISWVTVRRPSPPGSVPAVRTTPSRPIAWESHGAGVSRSSGPTRPRLEAVPAGRGPRGRRRGPGRRPGRRPGRGGRAFPLVGTCGAAIATGAGVVDAGDRTAGAGVRRAGRALRAGAPGDRHRGPRGGAGSGADGGEGRVRRPGGRDHLGDAHGGSGGAGDPRPAPRPGGHRDPGAVEGPGGAGRPGSYGDPGDPASECAGGWGVCGILWPTWWIGPGRAWFRCRLLVVFLVRDLGRGPGSLCYRPRRARVSGLQRTPVDGTRRCPLRVDPSGSRSRPPTIR